MKGIRVLYIIALLLWLLYGVIVGFRGKAVAIPIVISALCLLYALYLTNKKKSNYGKEYIIYH